MTSSNERRRTCALTVYMLPRAHAFVNGLFRLFYFSLTPLISTGYAHYTPQHIAQYSIHGHLIASISTTYSVAPQRVTHNTFFQKNEVLVSQRVTTALARAWNVAKVNIVTFTCISGHKQLQVISPLIPRASLIRFSLFFLILWQVFIYQPLTQALSIVCVYHCACTAAVKFERVRKPFNSNRLHIAYFFSIWYFFSILCNPLCANGLRFLPLYHLGSFGAFAYNV